jgi:hypothetical protein
MSSFFVSYILPVAIVATLQFLSVLKPLLEMKPLKQKVKVTARKRL